MNEHPRRDIKWPSDPRYLKGRTKGPAYTPQVDDIPPTRIELLLAFVPAIAMIGAAVFAAIMHI